MTLQIKYADAGRSTHDIGDVKVSRSGRELIDRSAGPFVRRPGLNFRAR